MAGKDDIPVLEEWIPTPQVAAMFAMSDSGVRRGVFESDWFLIDPDINKTEVAKIVFRGNLCYVVRRHAVLREKARREPIVARREEKKKQKVAQGWRVRFREWARAEGHLVRVDRQLDQDLVKAYKHAHPEDPPPEGYDPPIRHGSTAR